MIDSILNKYINNERTQLFDNYTPDAIKELLSLCFNPQDNYITIHIAGTNGKGTVCYSIAHMLSSAKFKTGLYVSPHLLKLNERITIDSIPISDEELLGHLCYLDEIASRHKISLTYFDMLTAVAFLHFKKQQVDFAVIETGLGGRLDSTNVIKPIVSVITDISYDHTSVLGSTLELIAKEKSGIIKPGVPVVTSNTKSEVLDVIKNHALASNSKLYVFNEDYYAKNISYDKEYLKFIYNFRESQELTIRAMLFPDHQSINLSSAITAILLVRSIAGISISNQIIENSLYNLKIPGRFEKLSRDYHIYFDPAHNISALENLFNAITERFKEKSVIFVMSIMEDKFTPEVRAFLYRFKENIVYYQLNDKRCHMSFDDEFSFASEDKDVIFNRVVTEIINGGVVLFTGTFRIYELASYVATKIQNNAF